MKKIIHINFAKTINFIKSNLIAKSKRKACLVLSSVLLSVITNIYKSEKEEQYHHNQIEMNPVIDIVSNKEKWEFIQKHSFNGKSNDINKYMRRIFQETYAKLTDIKHISETKIDKISVKTMKISGIFWHDVFIFDFLDKIQNFSPGFVDIISINIDKFARKITHKPIIKLEVTCKIFQKL